MAAASPDRPAARVAVAAGRVVDALSTAAMAVSAAATVLMTVLITVEVIGRSVFRVSTLVSDEMSGYLLVVLTFFGLADSLRSDSFIRVAFVYDRLSGARARRWLDGALFLAALGYTAFLGYHFWAFVAESYRFGTTSIYFTGTPLWIPQLFMAAGTSLLLLAIVAALVRRLVTPTDRA
ncbi:MAG: TRAP transporter small permease [Candidatus Rokubacteria bacterium]|nr:TRAP transporter small permease [Candidatus Rokubacteria bacterium]